METCKIDVCGNGYVRYIKHIGSDLDVVNSARASFLKEKDHLDQEDISLIKYLAKHNHTSPLRGCFITFEIKMNIMTKNQMYRHLIGSNFIDQWNEASRRYVTLDLEFYRPENWRFAPENKKQGSAGNCPKEQSARITKIFDDHIENCLNHYNTLLHNGVAPEQARLFLPAYSLLTTFRWTASLQAVLNFLELRLDPHAQWEIQQYAKAILELIKDKFPYTIKYFLQITTLTKMNEQ